MRLLHLTNYYGAVIRPRRNRGNKEVAFPCIWTQAVPGYRKGCCPGFGRRSIFVGNRDCSLGTDLGSFVIHNGAMCVVTSFVIAEFVLMIYKV